ncbi:MAG: flagellar hook capping FlgD N-terminal domain-containing protein [Mycobacteriales bacterium]
MTTPISGVTGTTSTTQTAPTEDPTGGKDMFMKLLVAQLKYQNPMSPADGNQYMSQMAVFTQVEKLGQLVDAQTSAQQWQQRIAADALVGRRISGTADDKQTHTGIVTKVNFSDATMTLDDGSTVAVENVHTVEQQ